MAGRPLAAQTAALGAPGLQVPAAVEGHGVAMAAPARLLVGRPADAARCHPFSCRSVRVVLLRVCEPLEEGLGFLCMQTHHVVGWLTFFSCRVGSRQSQNPVARAGHRCHRRRCRHQVLAVRWALSALHLEALLLQLYQAAPRLREPL